MRLATSAATLGTRAGLRAGSAKTSTLEFFAEPEDGQRKEGQRANAKTDDRGELTVSGGNRGLQGTTTAEVAK